MCLCLCVHIPWLSLPPCGLRILGIELSLSDLGPSTFTCWAICQALEEVLRSWREKLEDERDKWWLNKWLQQLPIQGNPRAPSRGHFFQFKNLSEQKILWGYLCGQPGCLIQKCSKPLGYMPLLGPCSRCKLEGWWKCSLSLLLLSPSTLLSFLSPLFPL